MRWKVKDKVWAIAMLAYHPRRKQIHNSLFSTATWCVRVSPTRWGLVVVACEWAQCIILRRVDELAQGSIGLQRPSGIARGRWVRVKRRAFTDECTNRASLPHCYTLHLSGPSSAGQKANLCRDSAKYISECSATYQ